MSSVFNTSHGLTIPSCDMLPGSEVGTVIGSISADETDSELGLEANWLLPTPSSSWLNCFQFLKLLCSVSLIPSTFLRHREDKSLGHSKLETT